MDGLILVYYKDISSVLLFIKWAYCSINKLVLFEDISSYGENNDRSSKIIAYLILVIMQRGSENLFLLIRIFLLTCVLKSWNGSVEENVDKKTKYLFRSCFDTNPNSYKKLTTIHAVKARSLGVIATAIYLIQIMDCMGFSVVEMTPCPCKLLLALISYRTHLLQYRYCSRNRTVWTDLKAWGKFSRLRWKIVHNKWLRNLSFWQIISAENSRLKNW